MIADKTIKGVGALVGVGAAVAVGRAAMRARRTHPAVAGEPRTAKALALEIGAHLVQKKSPLQQFGVHLVGFHPLRDDPCHQMLAHHYCHQVNEDFMQCVIFDGDGPDARLNGIEFIISERLYETLPEDEKHLWHPHNYEILSGQLTAPGIPDVLEQELMRSKMNSYGKTWHVWMTGGPDNPGHDLPHGPACLAWSFNRDGEIDPRLLEERDARYGIETSAKREARASLIEAARPQRGVDALAGAFAHAGHRPVGNGG